MLSLGFSSTEFNIMKLWSGWAHTLRTKESRRKKELDVEEKVLEVVAENSMSNMSEDRSCAAVDSNTEEIIKETERGSGGKSKSDNENREEEEKVIFNAKNVETVKEVERVKEIEKEKKNNSNINDKYKYNENENEEDDEKEEHSVPKESSFVIRPTSITYSDMATTGKMIKRIFDQGRVEYCRSYNLNSKQIRYCDEHFSPENIMIIATK